MVVVEMLDDENVPAVRIIRLLDQRALPIHCLADVGEPYLGKF